MPGKKKNNKKKKAVSNGVQRELIRADLNGQVYGKVEKLLGSGHFEILCIDGRSRRCRIRGSMRRRCRINVHDFVIISLREFDDSAGDIIYKYTSDEVRILQREGEIPSEEKFSITGTTGQDDGEDIGMDFDFDDI